MAHRWSEGHYLDLLLWGLVVFLMLLLLSKKYMFLMFQMSMVWGQPADLAPPPPFLLGPQAHVLFWPAPSGLHPVLEGLHPVLAHIPLWPAPSLNRRPCVVTSH